MVIVMNVLEMATDPSCEGYWAYCPGCRFRHFINVADNKKPRWSFSGSLDCPTFSPSLLVRYPYALEQRVCHSFIVNGQWQFLADCTHALAGQTVDMVDVNLEEFID